MKTHPYKVTVVDMRGSTTQEIVWAVDEENAKETVQMSLSDSVDVYKIDVDYPTRAEMREI